MSTFFRLAVLSIHDARRVGNIPDRPAGWLIAGPVWSLRHHSAARRLMNSFDRQTSGLRVILVKGKRFLSHKNDVLGALAPVVPCQIIVSEIERPELTMRLSGGQGVRGSGRRRGGVELGSLSRRLIASATAIGVGLADAGFVRCVVDTGNIAWDAAPMERPGLPEALEIGDRARWATRVRSALCCQAIS
jgi:hypothetical protein